MEDNNARLFSKNFENLSIIIVDCKGFCKIFT